MTCTFLTALHAFEHPCWCILDTIPHCNVLEILELLVTPCGLSAAALKKAHRVPGDL